MGHPTHGQHSRARQYCPQTLPSPGIPRPCWRSGVARGVAARWRSVCAAIRPGVRCISPSSRARRVVNRPEPLPPPACGPLAWSCRPFHGLCALSDRRRLEVFADPSLQGCVLAVGREVAAADGDHLEATCLPMLSPKRWRRRPMRRACRWRPKRSAPGAESDRSGAIGSRGKPMTSPPRRQNAGWWIWTRCPRSDQPADEAGWDPDAESWRAPWQGSEPGGGC